MIIRSYFDTEEQAQKCEEYKKVMVIIDWLGVGEKVNRFTNESTGLAPTPASILGSGTFYPTNQSNISIFMEGFCNYGRRN